MATFELMQNVFLMLSKKYFSSIGPTLAIHSSDRSFVEFLTTYQCNSFYLTPVTSIEAEDIISRLDAGKAVGPHVTPLKIIKMLRFVLSYPLSHLFNCSFSLGLVTDKLKVGKIIPLY